MTTLFRLDASIRVEGSSSRALADGIEGAVLADRRAGDLVVRRRDIGLQPVPSTTWAGSLAAGFVPEESRTAEQRESRALSQALADELEQADGYLFAVPLYNWGVSQHFKTWADVVMTDPRFGPRSSTIAGRPAVLVIARGGDYRDGSDRADWDHAAEWLRRILVDVWHLQVTVVEVGLTLAPVREHMAHLRDDATADLVRAHADAVAAGEALARSLTGRLAA